MSYCSKNELIKKNNELHFGGNMTEKKILLETQLQIAQNELNSLKKIGYIFGSNLTIDQLLSHVVEEVCELLKADRGSLFLIDRDKNMIWSKIALKSEIKAIELPIGKGIAGYVAETGEVINIPDAYKDERFNPEVDKRTGYHTRSILCAPLRKPVVEDKKEGEIIAVVQLLNKNDGKAFTDADEELLLSFGGSIASSINNAKLFHQLEEKFQEVELMYSTEHLIASNYNLDSLIEELLTQFFNYLDVKAGGVVFKENGNYRAFWKIMLETDSPLISQNVLVLPEGMPFLLEKSNTIYLNNGDGNVELKKYYESMGISPAKILFIPLQSGEKYLGNLQLLFLDAEHKVTVQEKVWEILSSQIARAYELFKMREGLIKNERLSLLGNMMSLIVHDLRSPLNNIVGFADLMTDLDTTDTERKDYQQIINKEINLMTNMTREILDFAKGKSNILPGKVGVTEICRNFMEKIKFDLERNQVELETKDFPRGKLWVDKERLLRAFTNIAKNAIEAMGSQGTPKKLKLWVEEKDKVFIFHIKDTGPGIPANIQENLFDEYVTSGKEGGTGLGLAIVKKIVEEHKGEIEFLTEKNKGTEFIINIPSFEKLHG